MRLHELSMPDTKLDAEPILQKAGWTRLGTGYNAVVYGKEGYDYVLKMFDADDKGYIDFLKLIAANPNKHFPRIKGKPIQITKWYWAVRMEKLIPFADNDYHGYGVYLITRDKGPWPGNDYQVEAHHKLIAKLEHEPEMKQALDLIIDNLLPKYTPDLHNQNAMKRADGTVVIIDPVDA